MRKIKYSVLIIILIILSARTYSENVPEKIGLQESLRIAHENNMDIKLAILRHWIFDTNIQASFSRLYPNINLNSSFSSTTIKRTGTVNIEGVEFDVSDRTTSQGYSYGISIAQWVFLPQNYLDIKNLADSDTRIAILTHQEQLQNIYYNIIQNYYNYLKTLSLYELAMEDLQTTRDHYNKTKNMFELGLIDRLALSNAEISLQSKEFNLIKAQNDMDIARIEYLDLIGVPLNSNTRIYDDEFRFSADSLSIDQNYAFAKENNISILNKMEQAQKAKHNHRRSRNELLPNISLNSSFSYSGDEFPTSDYRLSGSIAINFNLFRGFQDRYNISIADMRAREHEIELAKLKNDTQLRLKKAIANINVSNSLMALSSSREKKAKGDIELAEARYSAGLAIYLEVEDAKISYIKAKSDRISSYYDNIMANIALLISRGDFLHEVESIIFE